MDNSEFSLAWEKHPKHDTWLLSTQDGSPKVFGYVVKTLSRKYHATVPKTENWQDLKDLGEFATLLEAKTAVAKSNPYHRGVCHSDYSPIYR